MMNNLELIKDVITLLGIPVAIYILWNIHIKVNILIEKSDGRKPKSGLSDV